MCELLATTEGRELIKDELEKAKAQLDSGEKQIKWRYVKRPDYLLEQLADLGVEKKEFPALDTVEVRNEDFITQDEIDYRLAGGSGFEHGKFRIYEYFMEGHDKKDNIAFLKNEYGTAAAPTHFREVTERTRITMPKVSVWRKVTMAVLTQRCF